MTAAPVLRRNIATLLRVCLTATLLGALMAGMLVAASRASAAPPSPYFSTLLASGDTELGVGRYGPMTVELPNGQVLIAGGYNETTGFLQSAELFNPVSDTFTALPASGATELQTGRAYAGAALLTDGDVLIAGGYGSKVLQSAELFNPVSDTFTALAASGATELQTGRTDVGVAALGDGQALIADGRDQEEHLVQSAELFDPTGDTFTALPASGATKPQTARESPTVAPLPSGQVLITGGYDGSTVSQDAELFNPASDSFTALPAAGASELQSPREEAAATALPDGLVLIVGGENLTGYLQSAELFDPVSDTFTALPAAGATELQTARVYPGAAALGDGRALIVGGVNMTGEPLSAELFYSAPQAQATGVDFGAQALGTSSPASAIVVTNVGAQALTIAATSLGGAGAGEFAITADACSGRTLAFKQSCSLAVRFAPTTLGADEAKITLSDNELSPTAIALSGTGVPPPPALAPVVRFPCACRPAPVLRLSSLSESAKTWREGNALARISARKKPPLGTTFSFTLNIPASVTFTFTRTARGRKVGKTCVVATKENNKKHHCTRTVTAGALTFSGHAGTNKVRFEGLISKHKKLGTGSYTLTVRAIAAGKQAMTGTLHFTIAS